MILVPERSRSPPFDADVVWTTYASVVPNDRTVAGLPMYHECGKTDFSVEVGATETVSV
ncbi:hypothetical protein [Haladaptatus sp. R4]|uniref:hypothetical protein n=1 Tax=Haladaptatus sp. R4 TaxID=1679489 RepID=UPI000AD7D523|nr:hypothetical protein [Haladaptatus sp. R4]